MAVPTVADGTNSEETLTKDLFSSKNDDINANISVVESVSESSQGKHTKKMEPFSSRSSRATIEAEIPSSVSILATSEVQVKSLNFI